LNGYCVTERASAVFAGTERIGPDYLGYVIPLATFVIALFSVVVLYRRFMNR
jgi:hypothetical protein